MSDSNCLFEVSDLVLKKKILSVREHHDLENRAGMKLGEAHGNLLQLPAKFVVVDTHGSELMGLDRKVISLRNQFTFYHNAGGELGTIKKKIAKLIGDEFWVERWRSKESQLRQFIEVGFCARSTRGFDNPRSRSPSRYRSGIRKNVWKLPSVHMWPRHEANNGMGSNYSNH